VLDGDPAPLLQKGNRALKFWPIFRGTALNFQCPLCPNDWMDYKMPFGIEVGLGPGDFVFDGDS